MFDMVINHVGYGVDAASFSPFNSSEHFHDCQGVCAMMLMCALCACMRVLSVCRRQCVAGRAPACLCACIIGMRCFPPELVRSVPHSVTSPSTCSTFLLPLHSHTTSLHHHSTTTTGCSGLYCEVGSALPWEGPAAVHAREHGKLSGLPDLNHTNPAVLQLMKDVLDHTMATYAPDALRFDAAGHSDLVRRVHTEQDCSMLQHAADWSAHVVLNHRPAQDVVGQLWGGTPSALHAINIQY